MRSELICQFAGVVKWVCPTCGRFNSNQVSPDCYRVRCKYKRCRAMFAIGFQYWSMRDAVRFGRALPRPPDTVFPPTLQLSPVHAHYRPGQKVHELVGG